MDGVEAIRIIEGLGLSQAEAARVVGISATAVQKWKSGGKVHPSTATLLKLLRARPELVTVIKRWK